MYCKKAKETRDGTMASLQKLENHFTGLYAYHHALRELIKSAYALFMSAWCVCCVLCVLCA